MGEEEVLVGAVLADTYVCVSPLGSALYCQLRYVILIHA